MYDIIGDIHGHAGHLKRLLTALGYARKGKGYAHPERQALFLGDYIDRGPSIPKTLEIVRNMVDDGHAIAIMGNHEYNALCFHFTEREGGHLRSHSIKNILQHIRTLRQFKDRQDEYEEYLTWFKSLPLYIEVNGIRAVHACWHPLHIRRLRETLVDDRLNDDLIYAANEEASPLNAAVEITLKGMEIPLPPGVTFKDKDGHTRTDIRVMWWHNAQTATYKTYSIEDIPMLPDDPIPEASEGPNHWYGPDEPPVFFGHYWLKNKNGLFRDNVCCLDYSVAKKGHLAAYRYNGEQRLLAENIIYV